MTKQQAIKSAQEKANLSKQNQVVFRYINDIEVVLDYTAESLWERRYFRVPITTKVIIVTPDKPGQEKLQKV